MGYPEGMAGTNRPPPHTTHIDGVTATASVSIILTLAIAVGALTQSIGSTALATTLVAAGLAAALKVLPSAE